MSRQTSFINCPPPWLPVIVQTPECEREGNQVQMDIGGSKMWGRASEAGWCFANGLTVNCNQKQGQGKGQRTCKDKIWNYRHLSLFTFVEHSIGRARTLFINLSKRSENWSLFSQSFVQPFHQVAAFFQFASICRHVVVSMKTAL